jgi:hypothetical protein
MGLAGLPAAGRLEKKKIYTYYPVAVFTKNN